MNTQQMLQEIQDKIGDKTLSMGCVYEYGGEQFTVCLHIINFLKNNIGTYKIIGHPVMIGDVLEYLDDKGLGLGINQRYNDYGHTEIYSDGLDTIDLICAWKDLKKPISDQSPETIKAIWEIVCK